MPMTVEEMVESPPRAWAEIDLAAMRRNLAAIATHSGSAVMAVVKAGAYGHGLEAVAGALEDSGLAFFGVANVGEARRIRAAGVRTPIYLLGATWSEERAEIVARGWTPCLSTLAEAVHFDALARARGVRLKVHLSVDTGMGRGGFTPPQAPAAVAKIESMPHLELDGIGSHLSSADEDEEFTRGQFACFREVIETSGGTERFRWRHLANSAGASGYPADLCNLIRPGLLLYGVSPLPEFQDRLETVIRLKSRVTLVRELPAGHSISYGRDFVTPRAMRVATVGIGYGDGYPRAVSNHNAEVAIRGQRYRVLGRVTMDQLIIDAGEGEKSVHEGDEVELFGDAIPAREVAEKAGTIAWELFTGITPRVSRIYRAR